MTRVCFFLGAVVLGCTACRATPPDGVFACLESSDCPLTQRCYDGICRLAPPATSTETIAAEDASSMPQEQPVQRPGAAGETAEDASADAGGDTHVEKENSAGGSGGPGASASAGPTRSCSCSTKDDCCDGCQPIHENGSCGAGPSCMQPVCRAGVCSQEIAAGFCLVAGICYQAGQAVSTNACSYCDVSRSRTSLSPAAAGTACDDRSFCTGADRCDERGECSRHAGAPCPAGGCMACREAEKACVPAYWTDTAGLEWTLWHDDPRMNCTQAQAICGMLALCGRDDWRLPTIDELRTLVRNCPATQPGGSCTVTDDCRTSSCNAGCNGCGAANDRPYWPVALGSPPASHCSSTAITDRAGAFWTVDFATGSVLPGDNLQTSEIRCVRGSR